jgi:hypothetical protein
MRIRFLPASVIIAVCSAAPLASISAHACEGKAVQFEEAFQTPDPGWGNQGNERQKMADGSALLTALPNAPWWSWNATYVFDAADICADVSLKTGEATPETGVGLMFWVADNSTLYAFSVYGDGTARVYRMVGGRWLTPAINKPIEAKLEPGKTVKMRIVTKGNEAKLYVDGKEIGAIKGQPPSGGGAVGLYVQTEDPNKEAVGAFSNLKVTSSP